MPNDIDGGDRTPVVGLFNTAQSYWCSAAHLNETQLETTHPQAPVTFLLCHAIELYLKAFLRSLGTPSKELKEKFRHKLGELSKEAHNRGLVLQQQHLEALSGINTEMIFGARYIRTGAKDDPPYEALSNVVNYLDRRVHEHLKRQRVKGVGRRRPKRKGGRVDSPNKEERRSDVSIDVSTPESASVRPQASQRESKDITQFIRDLDGLDIVRFYIIAITGRATVPLFLNAIERSAFANRHIECKLLLRSPLSSDKRRADAFGQTEGELRRFQSRHAAFEYEIRTYASTIPLHSILAEFRDGRFSAYMSYYDWTHLNWREGTSNYVSTAQSCHRTDLPLGVYLSWFEHFWGRYKVHTILFDFDDTLFLTTSSQVKAWVQAIFWSLEKRIARLEDLREDIRAAFQGDAVPLMTRVFLEEQNEERIFCRIFEGDIGPDARRQIREQRVTIREKLTEKEAAPIAGSYSRCTKITKGLSARHRLGNKRVTDQPDTKKKWYGGCAFSFVLGREALTRRWHLVENKAQQFIRVSNMLGVPLERMIFVGDSDADYRAVAQLGLQFIENRYNAELHDMESLITTLDAKVDHFISKGDGELLAQVKRIEAEIQIGTPAVST